MNKATFVKRETRTLEPCNNTTVRALRNALETLGHELCNKHCMVKRGDKKVVAEPGYIIRPNDELIFDSEVEEPVIVTVSHKGKSHKFQIG